jgi:RNA polymerase sigma factor (sigma-70 family)
MRVVEERMEPKQSPPELAQARERFLELVAELRPELHRYCARLTGSIVEGEDVVQDTLAKAYYTLSKSAELPPLRPLLFRIAHNTAMDALRRYEHRRVEPMAEPPEAAFELERVDPEAIGAALASFLLLPVAQRSAVILKDVLSCTLEEIADATGSSLVAVKAALFRGRSALRARAADASEPTAKPLAASERELLHRYAALFNARDWDALRALIADDCRLDLVSRAERRGKAVGEYFSRYADIRDLHLVVGTLDGRPALAMYSPRHAPEPSNFVFIDWHERQIQTIRDFRYVPYIANEVALDHARFRPDDRDDA